MKTEKRIVFTHKTQKFIRLEVNILRRRIDLIIISNMESFEKKNVKIELRTNKNRKWVKYPNEKKNTYRRKRRGRREISEHSR